MIYYVQSTVITVGKWQKSDDEIEIQILYCDEWEHVCMTIKSHDMAVFSVFVYGKSGPPFQYKDRLSWYGISHNGVLYTG